MVGGEGDGGLRVEELARRLGMEEAEVRGVEVGYSAFSIPKRSGGSRRILAPNAELKLVQRRINRRVLGRLRAHGAVTGFERGHSIVTNARLHAGQAVVVRIDIREFFGSTGAKRVEKYFRVIGWDREAAGLLMRLCTHDGALPQGAPTSPRLSNLVNYRMDARVQGLADKFGARYSRYADDMTFSLAVEEPGAVCGLLGSVPAILHDFGYRMHMKRKLHIRRRHQRQEVTGLVVNDGVNLPRQTRRWLRAVEDRARNGGEASLSASQIDGWRSLVAMVEAQREG